MRIVRLALKRETAAPVVALSFASGANVALVLARSVWSWDLTNAYLVWNLFLVWLPLVFALLACEEFERTPKRDWRFWAFAGSWLLFFPNAPYIFTDIVHVWRTIFFYTPAHLWADIILIFSTALTGLVLGFLSLYLMQQVVTRMCGRLASWGFIAMVAGLGGFGIWLGRFSRFNSWDVLFRPVALTRGVGGWVLSSLDHPSGVAFPLMFGIFLFLAYLMLYALTHLKQAQPTPARWGKVRETALDRMAGVIRLPAHNELEQHLHSSG